MPDYKARIIFFHGYTQTSSIFYAKTSALRKKLNKLNYKCIYLNGPLKLTPAEFPSNDALSKFNSIQVDDDEESHLRAWWVKPHKSNDGIDIGAAIDTIKDYIDNNKIIEDDDLVQDINEQDKLLPIAGLIGFSQGSALLGLLMNKFNDIFNTKVEFIILYSGFKIETTSKSGNSHLNHYYDDTTHKFKVLQVIGELDSVVDEERALKLYEKTKTYSTLLKHPGGHFVPNSKMYVEQVTNWIVEEKVEIKETEDDLDDILNMMDNIGGL